MIEKATARLEVRRLAQRGFDVYINLCDGTAYEDRAGVDVILELEQLQLSFTGTGSSSYDIDREALRYACSSVGVDMPNHVL